VVAHKYAAVALHPCRPVLYAGDMAQSTDNGDRSNVGTPYDISRLTVPEAARALGISPEAVRNRLSRRTLRSVKEDGTVYVLLEADRLRHTGDTPDGTSRYTDGTSDDIPMVSDSLIFAKDETIRVLSEQLEAERTASAELRRIVAGLVQRVPELEATPAQRESSQTPSEQQGNRYSPGSQEQERRSWWRRIFEG
jgi:DNA-binding Lrp family transcriptional regulator